MNAFSVLQTPVTHNIADSVNFYQKLGFQQLESGLENAFTDGKVIIAINPQRTARTAVCLHGDWNDCLGEIKSQVNVMPVDDGWLCSDPSGVRVVLQENESFEISGTSTSILGNFSGLSIETTDCERTCRFWETLGYEISAGAMDQGWVSLSHESFFGISMMAAGACPHLFFSPGLTFFNSGNNLENIAQIRAAGIEITEEIACFNSDGVTDNVILRDPGGTGFFVFND